MYAAGIVEQRLEIAREELGFRLEYHTPTDIANFNSQLEKRYADAYAAARGAATGVEDHIKTFRISLQRALQNPESPRLNKDEVKFIQNERALIMCDAAYFLTRYYWVINQHSVRELYRFRAGQRILFDIMAEMESKGFAIEIILAKARQLGMCLDPATKVLTADLNWVSIDDLKIGQRVVATEETSSKTRYRCMREAVVEAKADVFEEAFLLKMSNSRELIATGGHRFLSKKNGDTDTCWRAVDKMKSGDVIRYITNSWGNPTYEDGWMGGMLDGEGSLRPKERAGSELCVAQIEGPVLERARKYLRDGDYTFREDWDNRTSIDSSKFGSKPVCRLTLGRMDEIFRLLGQTKPTRLCGKEWWQWKCLPRQAGGWVKILSIKSVGKRRMVDLQTSMGTFIAEGFVSHNSTIVAGLELLKVMFSAGVSGIFASADTGKTRELAGKIFLAYDSLPWWLAPLTTRRVESENGLISFVGDSRLVFQHGKQTNPIAMGSTPITYHLSEVSAYPDPQNLIEVGLFKCVHPSPRVLGILESTCKGDTGWWYDTYWNCKRSWKSGGSRLMALFLPFYCDTDMYPNNTWIWTRPVPDNWKPAPETLKMIAESELYVQTNPVLDKVLKAKQGTTSTWRLPREQAWYWEVNFKEHRSKGAEKTWFQEMPHTDEAAFQGSYDNVFGRETIAEVYTERSTQYHVYAIVGQSIEDRHDPDRNDLDLTEEIVPVSYKSIQEKIYRWELWPLKWREPFLALKDINDDDSHMNKFFVWLPPEPGYDYSLGVDTSNGVGRDSTVFAVCRRGRTDQEQDVQAAEFRSNTVSHVEAYAWAMAISAYYARYMEKTTQFREPYVAVEQIAAVGDTCQFQMGKMGYKRFHRMTRMDSTTKNMRKANSHRLGWYTSGWSRPALTDGFVVLIKNGWYKVNSPYTMREMTQWEIHYTTTNKEKYEHASDFTDDGIFANAMAAFCPNDQKTMADRSKKQYRGPGKVYLPELDLRTSAGIMVPTDSEPLYERFRV